MLKFLTLYIVIPNPALNWSFKDQYTDILEGFASLVEAEPDNQRC
jgi:hypothetical protein